MNSQLAAMLEMAAVRDGLVVKLFWTAAAVLLCYAGLRAAHIPAGLRRVFVNAQLALYLFAWINLWLRVGLR